MPTTKTITVESLTADYAQPIANAVNIDHREYERTASGLSQLLNDAADQLGSDQISEWLEEAADDLDAIDRLGGDNEKTRSLLRRIDGHLYEARHDLGLI